MTSLTKVLGFMPFPRGGSSFVVREQMAHALHGGVDAHLITGSLGGPGDPGHARSFFADVPDERLHVMDYTAAQRDFLAGQDPFASSPPMHPSFEDKSGVADVVFWRTPPTAQDRMQQAWASLFSIVDTSSVDVAHLHHITPQYSYWAERQTALVGQLHGTELKFVEEALATTGDRRPEALRWVKQFRSWAASADILITVAEADLPRAAELLQLDRDQITYVRNGVDTQEFGPGTLSETERARLWETVLVTDPHGWVAGSDPGSIRYGAEEVRSAFFESDGHPKPVLSCVCRYLNWKRVPDVLEAYATARAQGLDAPLVIWGGYPGELEGVHPYQVAQNLGVDNVFFTGWRSLADLAVGYRASTALINAAESEPFGTAMVQALASGLPVISTRAGGPLSYLIDRGADANGWFYDVGKISELAALMRSVCADPDEARRRGLNAISIGDQYGWDATFEIIDQLHDEARERARVRWIDR